MMLSYLNVEIVKIPCSLKVMAFSIKCPLFCSHGKLIGLFLSMEFLTTYLIAMPQYEEMIAGEY